MKYLVNLFDELQKGVKIIDNGKELEFGRLIIIIDNKENKTELDSLYKNSSLLHNLITEPNVVINNNYPFSIFK